MADQHDAPRVFLSHSSHDKDFVRRLADDLRGRGLNVWLDEAELRVGDSIVSGVSGGLKDTDYLLVFLSQASIQSRWVEAELNAALMGQLSSTGTVVLPARLDDAEIPPLLRDRVYADFRGDYEAGLNALLRVLLQEQTTAASVGQPARHAAGPGDAAAALSGLKLADLRRRVTRRLGRPEVQTVWFDTFGSNMENDMAGRDLQVCVVEMFIRAQNRDCLGSLIENLSQERPDLANPR